MHEREARRALWLMLVVFVVGAVVAGLQQHAIHHENNFLIFRNAFHNLVAGRDLYAAYPAVHTDRFKYSPTFALLIGPIALLPVGLGLAFWDALNAAALWAALARLLPPRAALLTMLIVAVELFGSVQRSQSNGIVCALVIYAFIALEAGRPARAAASVAAGTMIKLFPLAAATLAVFHPRKRRFALALALSLVVLILLPLVVTTPAALATQYRSWRAIEQADALAGLVPGDPYLIGGVMQQLRLWTGVHWPNWPVQLAGTAILLLPLGMRRSRWRAAGFRLRFLASLLIYMVIFNHQAESPSFVIALTGVAIWFSLSRRAAADIALLAFALLFVTVAPSSLTPHEIRTAIVLPYGVKSIPCIVIWLVLQAELLGLRRTSEIAEVGELDAMERRSNG